MTQTSKSRKSQKVVKVIARYFIKATGAVVYKVQSSKGNKTYCTTIINGRATGCTCEAIKPCYHMTQLEQRERERAAQPTPDEIAATAEAANMQKLSDLRNFYEIVGPTKVTSDKRVEKPDHCEYCGHICKGGVCGYCVA